MIRRSMKDLLDAKLDEEADAVDAIEETLKRVRHLPPCFTFSSLSRLLAHLHFEAGDDVEGISSVIQSQGIVSRRRAIQAQFWAQKQRNQTQEKLDLIEKKCIDFQSSPSEDYDDVLKKLEEMPKEWTVLQVTCVIDSMWRYARCNLKKWTPKLHIVRLECGQKPEFSPLHWYLDPSMKDFCFLHEMNKLFSKNLTDELRNDRLKFWTTRLEVDESLKVLVSFLNNDWFSPIAPIFSGHLEDSKLKKSLRCRVNKILNWVMKTSRKKNLHLPEAGLCLIHKTAENIHLFDKKMLSYIFERVFRDNTGTEDIVKEMLEEFISLQKEFSAQLVKAKRHPVILLIDQKLDCLPLETLVALSGHPVTRISSFHILYGLFSVHRNSIRAGHKIVDRDSGFYLINPKCDLPKMEKRMVETFVPRIPKTWTGIIGRPLTKEDLLSLAMRDIFVYMGHGSGSSSWKSRSFKRGIHFSSLLFGCRSAGLKLSQGPVETDSSLMSLEALACPGIIGMLWEVTDRDTDLVTLGILDKWLLKEEGEEKENGREQAAGKGKGQKKAGTAKATPKMSANEMDLLRAVVMGREAARMYWTAVALVARGLPMLLK